MKLSHKLRDFCEYLNGCDIEPPARFATNKWLLGVWWGLLVAGIVIFSGQSSKFIYIDF